MTRRLLFILSALGMVAGIWLAWVSGIERAVQPPANRPVSSPWDKAIFTNGIVESEQSSGQNIPVYPEVAGVVAHVFVRDGQRVRKGEVLFDLEDSVPRTALAQARRQADVADAQLRALRAQPRPEVLAVAEAQVKQAAAALAVVSDPLEKRRAVLALAPGAISREALDTAIGARDQAVAALELAERQLTLTRAGAWPFDIATQLQQREALEEAVRNAQAILARYAVRARSDGRVLSVAVVAGASVGPAGVYNSYTQGNDPAVTLGSAGEALALRCYVDEILVPRLPRPDRVKARMTLRGTTIEVPLEFVRIQESLIPKVALSNQRQERVDLRVLPVVFRFVRPPGMSVYPGQMVDVYIGERED
jgi:HlyD family secretion protein